MRCITTTEVISHHTLSCVTQFPTWLELRATRGESIPTATPPKSTYDREVGGLTRTDFINRSPEVNQFGIDPCPSALSGDTALSIRAGCLLSASDFNSHHAGHLMTVPTGSLSLLCHRFLGSRLARLKRSQEKVKSIHIS